MSGQKNIQSNLLPLNSNLSMIQIRRFNSNVNSHSKNKYIDSLINQKLN